MAAGIVLVTILLPGCGTRETHTPSLPNAIHSARVFLQDRQLRAEVVLNPELVKKIKELLRQGEPLQATYQFRLHRIHPWLPDPRLLQKEIHRHVRMRLITERYELMDEGRGLVQTVPDEEKAMQFFANPRSIPLHDRFVPLPGFRYRLTTRITITHEGMSRMFQFLDQWFLLSQQLDFIHISELNPR
ncbi:MAG: DUF4390 domain-containing protein [Magnetococcales bacterium]|nr:DUF4390 domain-containing protein [Magnetococcales bacterium]